uniref:Root cap protein 1-like n=1 Tax=Oryza sativa subsp. japonica TaxID=39947 RepID=Q5VQC1_ORYSJ|nr:root cap protein 1-like [Oryza sativa Japonica Group]
MDHCAFGSARHGPTAGGPCLGLRRGTWAGTAQPETPLGPCWPDSHWAVPSPCLGRAMSGGLLTIYTQLSLRREWREREVRQIGREAESGASPSRGGGGAALPECATTHRWPTILASSAPRYLAPAVSHLAPPFLSRSVLAPTISRRCPAASRLFTAATTTDEATTTPQPHHRRRPYRHDATPTTRPQATATPHQRHLKPHWFPHRHRCRADADASSSLAATVLPGGPFYTAGQAVSKQDSETSNRTRALAPCALALPSSPPLQPCAAVVSDVAVAREDHRRARQVVAVLVRPFAVAGDHRSSVAVVNPKVPAASSSSPSPSVGLPPSFWSPRRRSPASVRRSSRLLRRAAAAVGDVIADVIRVVRRAPVVDRSISAVRFGLDQSRPSVRVNRRPCARSTETLAR